jgi:hypothetical protein
LALRALGAGWSYECVPLYDEECLDGYRWVGPAGEEETCLQDDVVPDLFVARFASEEVKVSEERAKLADFLEKILLGD